MLGDAYEGEWNAEHVATGAGYAGAAVAAGTYAVAGGNWTGTVSRDAAGRLVGGVVCRMSPRSLFSDYRRWGRIPAEFELFAGSQQVVRVSHSCSVPFES